MIDQHSHNSEASHLPAGKTLAAFEKANLPLRLSRQLAHLYTGEFVTRTENCLIFGFPGGWKDPFRYRGPPYCLVDELLRAKRDLLLEHQLRRIDNYEVLILDDIGYVQQSHNKMKVLFTLMAKSYERRNVITSAPIVDAVSVQNRLFTMRTDFQSPDDYCCSYRPRCTPWNSERRSPATTLRKLPSASNNKSPHHNGFANAN